ncbi:DNA mismatch repair endonuclease MutL [bacterium]|nr:DNA mismatch repair endonuclease MutL [bacterium]MCP5462313.1 DNA mismatch repair endonuclease MutL [bacterium]
MSNKVRLLDDAVINKIAAGEVVGNPSSVLKELVENSIDAGATAISVNIVQSGMGLIRVADNGCGMAREDAALAIERHATSKLVSDKDLLSLSTLGFRGEALPSIAAVSKFLLRTSTDADSIGTRIRIDGGKLLGITDDSVAAGTIIEVKNLFFNVPARKKFIRSFNAEKMALTQVFIQLAIAHPSIDFSLIDEGKEIYRLVKVQTVIDRVGSIFGKDFTADLIHIENNAETFSVDGYISHPQLCRSTRSGQYLFVNGRIVQSNQIANAVRQAYGALLPAGRYPIFVINMKIDPSRIDVNVHPTKKEIKFTNIDKIEDTIGRIAEKYLKESKLIFDIREQSAELKKINLSYNIPRFTQIETDNSIKKAAQDITHTAPSQIKPSYAVNPKEPQTEKDQSISQIHNSGDMFIDQLDAILQQEQFSIGEPAELPAVVENGEDAEITAITDELGTSGIRVVGQIGKCFILGETTEGLVILDQHAAHERINFEKVLKGMKENTADSQELLFPVTYTADELKKQIILAKRELLLKAGISVEEFGIDMLIVNALPRCISPTAVKAVLEDLAEESCHDNSQSIENWQLKVAKIVACRSSVKAADKLELPELQKLIDDLFQCDVPYTCPHGRPTIIRMNYGQLRKHFQRE